MPKEQQKHPSVLEQEPTHIAQERNRYFTGKYMTARDFSAEQDYYLSHKRAHNRMFHGWGILCGLSVKPHWNVTCQDHWVQITAGVALDCYGREIYVNDVHYVELPLPPKQPENDTTSHFIEPDDGSVYLEDFFLCLQYTETYIEQVGALTGDHCDPSYTEANRIREEYAIVFKKRSEVAGDFWKTLTGSPNTTCRDDCGEDKPGPMSNCLDSHCSCCGLIPLALITPHLNNNRFLCATVPWFDIDMDGRHELLIPPDSMTHIVWTNWPHGGKMSIADLNKLNGRLEIHFDRRLQKPPAAPAPAAKAPPHIEGVVGIDINKDGKPDLIGVFVGEPREDEEGEIPTGTGVNSYTFLVQYSGVNEAAEFMPYEDGKPPHIEGENDHIAVFTINKALLHGRNKLGGQRVYITLKCDFILDCHGKAVDGNHIGGRKPSGDGVEGGTFESWFYITD